MNANRKADLQRKLTLAPVPKPPAGLAERIKREIPKELRFNAEKERERLSKAVAFNLRVAASILILVSSAYLGLQLLSRLDQNPTALQTKPAKNPAVYRALPQAVPEPAVAKQLTYTSGFKNWAQFSPDNKEIFFIENGRIGVVNLDIRPPAADPSHSQRASQQPLRRRPLTPAD